MSTRQNKKRKGRSNAMNRERTVTTLTEGPESSFLIPTPTEEPAGNLMSSPFSVASSGGGSNISPAAAFQLAPNSFAPFPYNGYMPPMPPPNFGPPQQHFFPSPPGPPGQKDLEALERLKDTIKNGQHEFFRAVPQPAVLANLYQGPRQPQSQVPPHPEQASSDRLQTNIAPKPASGTSYDNPAQAAAGLNPELNTRLGPQKSDHWDGSRKLMAPPSVSDSYANTNAVLMSPASTALSVSHTSSNESLSRSVPTSGNDPRLKDSDANVSNKPLFTQDAAPRSTEPERADNGMGIASARSHEPHSLSRTQSEKSLVKEPSSPEQKPFAVSQALSSVYDGRDDTRVSRESSWSYRNGMDKSRHEPDLPTPQSGRFSHTHDNDNRNPGSSPRFLPREKARELDRDRVRSKEYWERDRVREEHWDRDRDRRTDYTRPRDDKRTDDRPRAYEPRRPPTEQRPYDSRWAEASRRNDTTAKPPGDATSGASRIDPPDDRNPPDVRQSRPITEERSINRIPADVPQTKPPVDDHRTAVPLLPTDRPVRPSFDDRRGLPPPIDRQVRDSDDRRAPPSPVLPTDRSARPFDDRRHSIPPSSAAERPARPMDDRRLLVPPPATTERQMRPPEDRRLPPPSPVISERSARSSDDRRPPPPPPTVADRQVRTVDERRLPLSSGDRSIRPPVDDRRPPLPSSIDRAFRPAADDRRPNPAAVDERTSRPPVGSQLDSIVPRPSVDEHIRKPVGQDDIKPRLSGPLEDRISRPPPLLQDRLGTGGRPDGRLSHPPSRADDRSGRPAPTLEERLSLPPGADDRAPRPPHSEDRAIRPAAFPSSVSDRVPRPGPPDDRNTLLAEPARPVAGHNDRLLRPDERGRPPVSDRFGAPVPPSGERNAPPRAFHPAPRATSVARSSPRGPFKPRSRTRSPARSDIREFRPAGDHPRERSDLRPPYREADRYANDRRVEPSDVDPPSRFGAPYRRPATPVAADEPYTSRARPWAPSGETFTDDPARRPVDAHAYGRDWREGDHAYPDDWDARNGRTWERPVRDYDRDRVLDRDAGANNGWETREERERRVSSSFPPPPEHPAPAPRSFEQRPLSSRLTDGYIGDEPRYGREPERPHFASTPPPAVFSRVRPRSPSPVRRPGAVLDDLRPPVKRPRDDAYGSSGYYPPAPPPAETLPPRSTGDYPPSRLRTPPPASSASYYDDLRASAPPPYNSSASVLPRDRDYVDSRERAPEVTGYVPYDRREPVSRMPPPRSPPYSSRYGRDDRRYSVPPRNHIS